MALLSPLHPVPSRRRSLYVPDQVSKSVTWTAHHFSAIPRQNVRPEKAFGRLLVLTVAFCTVLEGDRRHIFVECAGCLRLRGAVGAAQGATKNVRQVR